MRLRFIHPQAASLDATETLREQVGQAAQRTGKGYTNIRPWRSRRVAHSKVG
ncbi:MAG: hypothetical protein KME60_23935 [Cyanomargarita calcarea GSE-NOS-MK-12-04C]|uniref:Uncharacterized protein n=1 Tax=Cyanomargarita calcarea GSE-NOS-MK-12-04C TaxID=2839659 RepID=A0A951QQS2_9CYAN|nr:hypothetical protein [Cyanomargarita calcarea GSE-NOS-MK-12-04C]